jgi:hypothetical protein
MISISNKKEIKQMLPLLVITILIMSDDKDYHKDINNFITELIQSFFISTTTKTGAYKLPYIEGLYGQVKVHSICLILHDVITLQYYH